MPYDVYSIPGPNSQASGETERVANGIRQAYERAAENGGRIVGEHTVRVGGRDEVRMGSEILYLVAQTGEEVEPTDSVTVAHSGVTVTVQVSQPHGRSPR